MGAAMGGYSWSHPRLLSSPQLACSTEKAKTPSSAGGSPSEDTRTSLSTPYPFHGVRE
jgi:hypothetical protein